MHNDDHLREELRATLGAIGAPRVNVHSILNRETRAETRLRPRMRAGYAVLAAALALAFLPIMHADALLAAVGSNVTAFLRVIGAPSGPPVPRTLMTRLQAASHPTDFASAASAVPFTLVAPAGLPQDARLVGMRLSTPGEWSAKTKRWSLGSKMVRWTYTRPDGRTFALTAQRYDPHARYFAYIWKTAEGAPAPKGAVKVVRYDRFSWRVGNAVMGATADGIDAAEIARIRRAMHGIPIPGIRTAGPHGGRRLQIVTH